MERGRKRDMREGIIEEREREGGRRRENERDGGEGGEDKKGSKRYKPRTVIATYRKTYTSTTINYSCKMIVTTLKVKV
jgi:hypothetical protein